MSEQPKKEHPSLEQWGSWVVTFISDVKEGVEGAWKKVSKDYKEKFSSHAESETTVVPPKEEPGREDNEAFITHEEKPSAKKTKKK